MNPTLVQTLTFVTFMVLVVIPIEGKSKPNTYHQNNVTVVSSPWLKNAVKQRVSGCFGRPRVCSQGEFPARILCCRNRCVNVTSDRNNCGFCAIRCPFNWQCCGGFCRNINLSFLNCGRCGHRCPIGSLCWFGMCGYANEPASDSHQPHETARDKLN
ncbi:hypothetical protein RJT34_00498 [Clitoria ternatea]|uniref:Stigma-specific Stig1 family protein n=1 Tax=Clitoria ternatea TaxID=43366 RepID=A0AAN9KG25_CLITE